MNGMRIQVIIAVFLLFVLLILVRGILKKKLDIRYTLSWIVLVLILLFVDVFPQLLNWAANLMGIQVPLNMVFFLAIIFIGIIILSHTMVISKMTDTNKILIQEIALLKKRIEKLEETEGDR